MMKNETQLTRRQQLILAGVLRDIRGIFANFVNNRNVNKVRTENAANSGKTGGDSPRPRHGKRGRPRKYDGLGPHDDHGQDGKNGQDDRYERRWQRERLYRQVRSAREGLAAVNLWSWLGRTPNAADRVLCHRDLLRLEAAGLLKRQAGRSGRRTTHVKLTTPGHQIARRLLAAQDALAFDIATDEAFAVDDLQMLPLDWPMETQAGPGNAGEPFAPDESGTSNEPATPPSSPNSPSPTQAEAATPESPFTSPPPAAPPSNLPSSARDAAAGAAVGSFPCYKTRFARDADA